MERSPQRPARAPARRSQVKATRLRVEAEIDLFEAALWYETEREGLGFDFDAEVHRTLERIAENPNLFPVIGRNIRRAIVDRFPYGVFFIEHEEALIVIGILHLHRAPETWETR